MVSDGLNELKSESKTSQCSAVSVLHMVREEDQVQQTENTHRVSLKKGAVGISRSFFFFIIIISRSGALQERVVGGTFLSHTADGYDHLTKHREPWRGLTQALALSSKA